MKWIRLAVAITMITGAASAQRINIDLGSLADRAKSKVEVDLDQNMIQQFGGLAQAQVPEQFRPMLANLRSISVRIFEFAEAGQYTSSDLDQVRNQVRGDGWSRLVNIKDGEDTVEAHVFRPSGEMQGLVLIIGDQKDVVVVAAEGSIDVNNLQAMVKSTIQYQMNNGKSKQKDSAEE